MNFHKLFFWWGLLTLLFTTSVHANSCFSDDQIHIQMRGYYFTPEFSEALKTAIEIQTEYQVKKISINRVASLVSPDWKPINPPGFDLLRGPNDESYNYSMDNVGFDPQVYIELKGQDPFQTSLSLNLTNSVLCAKGIAVRPLVEVAGTLKVKNEPYKVIGMLWHPLTKKLLGAPDYRYSNDACKTTSQFISQHGKRPPGTVSFSPNLPLRGLYFDVISIDGTQIRLDGCSSFYVGQYTCDAPGNLRASVWFESSSTKQGLVSISLYEYKNGEPKVFASLKELKCW